MERGRKGVALTGAGERFLEHVNGTLAALRRGLDAMVALEVDTSDTAGAVSLTTLADRACSAAMREFMAIVR